MNALGYPMQRPICAGHADFDQQLTAMLTRARLGDSEGLLRSWQHFVDELENHLAYEEGTIFPDYECENEQQGLVGRGLRDEHLSLRAQLDVVKLDLELGSAGSTAVEGLIRALREHAEREAATVYRWLAERRGKRPR